jgi:hypothetical protein
VWCAPGILARFTAVSQLSAARRRLGANSKQGFHPSTKEETMGKLTRTLVLGAMVAVLSSATAAAAQPPAADQAAQAVQEFRAGERASMTEAAAPDQALQRFRAGERASQAQPAAAAHEASVAQQRRWYYQSTRVQPPAAGPQPAERGTPVALLAALGGAAVLALSLDALSVRRQARKATARAAT